MQVCFCNKQCQKKAHSIHKHHCLQPSLRSLAESVKVRPATDNQALSITNQVSSAKLLRPPDCCVVGAI